jgi:uncharacterized membrane protein
VVAINQSSTENKVPFRWTYVILPVAFFLLSLVLTAIFYRLLPSEVAYHFTGGIPDKTMPLAAFVGWMIIPQVFFTILSFTIARLIMLSARYLPAEGTPLKHLLPVMGNMVALPQIILFFAMLQFILYNAYQTRLIPLWIIALIILALGGIVLSVFFIRIIRRSRNGKAKIVQE